VPDTCIATSGAAATDVFDLRRWIDQARTMDQLKDVHDAEVKFEIGAITDLNAKRGGPALLFDKCPGYREGFRLLTGTMLNATTLGLTMGFSGTQDNLGVVDKVADYLHSVESRAKDFPVEEVVTGPVMDNVVTGDAVDLGVFPTPIWHELDLSLIHI